MGKQRRQYVLLGRRGRRVAIARCRAGGSAQDLIREFGVSRSLAYLIWSEAGLIDARASHSSRRLSWQERERISRGIAAGESGRLIARELGRSPSTVCREIARCGGRERYRALRGERLAQWRCRRPKPLKMAGCARLLAAVQAGLEEGWSPQQISARLKVEFPDDQVMRISHETIYQSLYVQSRGELRRQLSACLRSGRTARKPHGTVERRGQISDMINISQRPAEIEDRAVPGHWEGDLIVGKGGRSYVATLVERQTRYVMLARLGDDRSTATVIDAIKRQIHALPDHLKVSLTWDQGKELSAHRQFTVDTGVSVFFCDPHSPWQRGTNENTNGLLRQYLPKGTDLAVHTQADLDRIAQRLNGRPRETLGWLKPAEKMSELLTATPAQDR